VEAVALHINRSRAFCFIRQILSVFFIYVVSIEQGVTFHGKIILVINVVLLSKSGKVAGPGILGKQEAFWPFSIAVVLNCGANIRRNSFPAMPEVVLTA
jgi:hypothetical protein